MALSWNEIRSRAAAFSKDYQSARSEIQDYADFWTDFFNIFGVRRRSVASFQKPVQKMSGHTGFIDLLWKGVLLVEHKSKGEDLESAFIQANDYIAALPESERPRRVIVSDFENIWLYDLEGENGKTAEHEIILSDLAARIRLFGFIAGYEVRKYKEEDPVNKKAVKIVVELYRALYDGMYPKEWLSRLMVRFVFLFFADDTCIFSKRDIFYDYLRWIPKESGEDLGAHLGQIFEILNTPEDKRQSALSDDLKEFPYVDGTLFKDPLPLPIFNQEMYREIVRAAEFDWGAVSPAIFGSMFQYVMDIGSDDMRHDFGAHYTSEKNILKVIDGLFLDDIRRELASVGQSRARLSELWKKIASIKILDPACGCGNFLVVAYRELRRIELEIIKRLHHDELSNASRSALDLKVDVKGISKLTLANLSGIEILSLPAEIARLSLWLIDHQMNIELGNLFGKYFAKLPLDEQPFILEGNALFTDWRRLLPEGQEYSYILGNPPFIAKQDQSKEKKDDMKRVFDGLKGAGELDYVTAWYAKAADYIQGTAIQCAFVSTNSITQGEQVGILWPFLLAKGIHITFAHRTFRWTNEAPGRAAVHCVIIGFALKKPTEPMLWHYDDPAGNPIPEKVKNINPYLVDADDVVVLARRKPICDVPSARFGSMPNDSGFLLFDDEKAKDEFLLKEPNSEKFIRPLISAKEYLNGAMRYCLWLKNASPEEMRSMPYLMRKVESVRTYRELSTRPATRELANTPYLFGEDRQPEDNYILIPRVSSERRVYIPFSFFTPESIAGDTCIVIPTATLYHFGVLQSTMHMAWMRADSWLWRAIRSVRLELRYRYSNELVYNNFPWPKEISAEHRAAIDSAAQAVLDSRANHKESSLADLYDPSVTPKDLLAAHKDLDHAVDVAYKAAHFESEPDRLKFLFKLYEEYLASIKK
jgi:hypothetical protein